MCETADRPSAFAAIGQRICNWDDMGLIIQPDLEEASSSLSPYYAKLDRPHIIYNKWTKKDVCWAKVMNRDGSQIKIVLTGDDILGSYQIERDHVRPLGMNAGDFDLAVAPDGKAYYYFERVHSELICANLTDDYTDLTGVLFHSFPAALSALCLRSTCPLRAKPQALSHHVRNHGIFYKSFRGCHSRYLTRPFERSERSLRRRSDPHLISFQISSVFQVQGRKVLYIAMGDRWIPNDIDLSYPEYARLFEVMFSGRCSSDEIQSFKQRCHLDDHDPRDLSIADYVWLPLHFQGDQVQIACRNEWRIEEWP